MAELKQVPRLNFGSDCYGCWDQGLRMWTALTFRDTWEPKLWEPEPELLMSGGTPRQLTLLVMAEGSLLNIFVPKICNKDTSKAKLSW